MQLFNQIYKNEFFKNIFTLFSGTTISQLIPFLVAPLLTRVFYPEDFGVLSLYMSLLMFFSVISTGRYEFAIILPKSDKEAFSLSVLSIFLSFVFSLFLILIVVVFYNQIVFLFSNYQFGSWLYVLPVGVFLFSLQRIFILCLNRNKKYKNITFNRVLKSSSISSFQVLFGLLGVNRIGLIIGDLIGNFLSVIFLARSYIYIFSCHFKSFSIKSISLVLKKYKQFPIYNAPHALLDVLQINFVIFLITVFYNSTTLGFYALSVKIIRAPITLIGSSISNVLYQKLNKDYLEGKSIFNFTKRLTIILFVSSLPFFVLIYLYSEPLFSFFFGEEWKVSGKITSILVPWILFNFISNPISIIPNIIKKQKHFFILSLIFNLLSLFVFVFAHYLKQDFYFSIKMYSYFMALNCFVVVVWVIYVLNFVNKK
tara:strand:- start:865 stop:2142 length:1278 start_codon:yes stop_codon:yes gene_type:complete